jgi:hypothetical protein
VVTGQRNFGEGEPATGSQFDQSGRLRQLQGDVESAALVRGGWVPLRARMPPRITAMRRSSARSPISTNDWTRDFTGWSWDEVHLFHEYSDRDFIEKTVEEPVIKSKIYDSKASLLVFEDQGRPVKAIGVSGDYLRAQDTRVSWPATVMLEPMGTGYLQLTP